MLTQNIFELLNNERFWQVLLIVFTVYVTNFFSSIFESKKERKKTLFEAVSALYKIGYLLEKAAYSRYECEIDSIYYEGMYKLSPNPIIFEEKKRKILALPELADRMYELYAEAFRQINMIQQLISKKKYIEIRNDVEKILNYQTCIIYDPTLDQSLDMDGISNYRDTAISLVKEFTRKEILAPFRRLNKKLIIA